MQIDEEKQGDGALLSLVAKGAQDRYMDASAELFDARKQFLKEVHQFVYRQLDAEKKTYQETTTRFKIHRQCDLISCVDLALPNAEGKSINDILSRIETEIGGQRMDVLCVEDIETQIQTNCALLGRKGKITHINGVTFIPLVMAPLHENNLIFPSAQHHDFMINIQFKDGYDHTNVKLYAKCYFLETEPRRNLFAESHEFVTVQNQYCGKDTLQKGKNTIKLNFNHPVYLIYFWGFDKSKVKRVSVRLDAATFYDGPIEPLEHFKLSQGYNVDPVMLFFSEDKVTDAPRSSTNLSRIDRAELIIETDEEETKDVYVVGLNMQPLRYKSGMYGLAFSK